MLLHNLALILIQGEAELPPGTEKGTPQNFLVSMLPFIAIFAIFWFLMIRPEQKNRQRRETMISALKKGDKVMTQSGMFGTVTQIRDGIVTLQIADGVRVKYSQSAVQNKVDDDAGEDEAKS